MMETDVRVMSSGEKPRKYSIGKYLPEPDDIERITVPPSTELIPDEYEHEDNKMGLVVIFYSNSDVDNMELLKQALTDQGYEVLDANIHKMSTKVFVLETLRKIAKEDHNEKTCLIVIFMGNAEREDNFLPDEETDKRNIVSVRDVWTNFTANNCPTLKYKPKIFIFQASKKLAVLQDDGKTKSVVFEAPKGAYDIPAEADMLLVYKRTEEPKNRNNFVEQLCNNIHYDGLKDDMIGLVTHTHLQDEERPLIISTLTRKFYVRPSDRRGHHYDFHENHFMVKEALQDLYEKIKEIQEQQSAIKRKFEQRGGWKRQEQSASSSVVQSDDKTATSTQPLELRESKRVSRAASSASSVDSKSSLKTSMKKPVWKY